MKQETFQARHRAEWIRLGWWLDNRDRKDVRRGLVPDGKLLAPQDFPAAYRLVCQQLALAERRGYSELLLDELRVLVQRGHVLLYQPPKPRLRHALVFFASDFPRLVRAQGWALAISALLLGVPSIGFALLLKLRPELIYTLCTQSTLDQFREMYSATRHHADAGNHSQLVMFGFYIYNNVSIGFRTLASGLFACVGAVLVLISNGVLFGAIAGYLDNIGEGPQFWRFVVGHSGLELTAAVIAGAGGLRLGMAVMAPGRRTRGRALVDAGAECARLALGIFAMLVAAAFVEAFWSSLADVSDLSKYMVGAMVWLLVGGWLWRGGRGAVVPAAGA